MLFKHLLSKKSIAYHHRIMKLLNKFTRRVLVAYKTVADVFKCFHFRRSFQFVVYHLSLL